MTITTETPSQTLSRISAEAATQAFKQMCINTAEPIYLYWAPPAENEYVGSLKIFSQSEETPCEYQLVTGERLSSGHTVEQLCYRIRESLRNLEILNPAYLA